MSEKPNCYKVLIEEESGLLVSLYMTGESRVVYEVGKENFGKDGTPLFAFYNKDEAIHVASGFVPYRGCKVVVYEAVGTDKVKRPPFLLKLGYAKHSFVLLLKYWTDSTGFDRTYRTGFIPYTVLYKSILLTNKIFDGPVFK